MKPAVAALAALLAVAAPAGAAQRFAVIAGNDEGSQGRARLWYAQKDADRMSLALRELGDFPAANMVLLEGKDADAVRNAIASLDQKILQAKAGGERTLLFFYYSGHAGDRGLELGSSVLKYSDLRALVNASPADAKVAIVDACDAGRLTQAKGASFVSAVDFALPSDEVEGTAFIASSAAGESAQESAAIGGSFFTHHFEIGLRGAADADGDGQVTLSEAFRYTSVRTTSGTAATEAGPQHPMYDIKMSGRGDVVLADLRRAEATLRFPPDSRATFILHGPHNLLAEVPGAAEPLALALPAGRYTVERRAPEGRAQAELTLARADVLTLPTLSPTRYERARQKGGPAPMVAFLGGGVTTVSLPGFGFAPAVRAGLRAELGQFGLRFHAEVATKEVTDQFAHYTYWSATSGLALVTPLLYGPVFVEGGIMGGYGIASQSIKAPGIESHTGAGPLAGGVLQATMRVGRMRLGLDLDVEARFFRLNDASVAKPAASLSLVALFNP
ncbi:MAG TPA: caspase family protein [Myxococcales bacterium]|nr:caspase family protein [Myxococcales bacterium]